MKTASRILIAVLICVSCIRAEAIENRYISLSQAESAGCRVTPLKGKGILTCFLVEPDGQTMNVVIYDGQPDGTLVRTSEIAVPSWYLSAKFTPVMVSPSASWLVAETEGMRGTGIYQRLFIVLAWDGEQFRVISAESGEYTCSPPPAVPQYSLTVDRSFLVDHDVPSLHLAYALSKNESPVSKWSDVLSWDNGKFLLVPKRSKVESRDSVSDAIRMRITEVRQYLANHRPSVLKDGLDEWLVESKIKEILLPEGYP